MTRLQRAAEEYLAIRRGLGYLLRDQGHALRHFIVFCERKRAAVVTCDLAVQWAVSANASSARAAWRLQVVRAFARHHHIADPRTEIPSANLLSGVYHRRAPYPFTDSEVAALLRTARQLPPGTGLRPQTYATLFGLLAATGIRVGEALALDRADIDWEMGLLVIRRGKFGKARVVPIHNSTTGRLQRYEAERDRVHQTPRTPAFFVSESGGRLPYRTVSAMFRKVRESLHIRPPAGSRYPRLHDLRHRFAVTTLIRWYRNGEDVGRRSPVLSTYLGHTSPAHTYWYLSAVPELLCLATKRLESGGSRHEN